MSGTDRRSREHVVRGDGGAGQDPSWREVSDDSVPSASSTELLSCWEDGCGGTVP